MDFLIVRGQNKSVISLASQSETPGAQPIFPKAFPVRVAVVDEIADSGAASRYYQPDDMSLWAVRAAIGNPYTLPVAGTYTLTFTALDASTETTSALAYNASAGDVQAALNAGAKVTAAGGVVVTGENGYFFITFNNPANRTQITGTATNLAPLSIIEVGTLIDGSGSLDEVQTIRVTQNPATFVELTELSDAAGATVDVLATGGVGVNHKVRVTLAPVPFDGQFTLTVGGDETGFIAFDASAEDVNAALGALASVASVDNAQTVKEAAGQYAIAFIGAKAATNMGTITVDASALQVVRFLGGVLPTGVPGVELLLDSANSVATFFEIEGERDGGDTEELLLSDITLRAGVITPGAMQPQPVTGYYTQAQIDAFFDDDTGTGALVRAVSPALTTPALGVATATTLGVGAALSSVTPGGFGGGNAMPKILASVLTSGKYTQIALQGPDNGGAAVQVYNGSGAAVADFGANIAGDELDFINRMLNGAIHFDTNISGSIATRLSIASTGTTLSGKLNLSSIPTSSAGLSSGDVWNDSGTLKIV